MLAPHLRTLIAALTGATFAIAAQAAPGDLDTAGFGSGFGKVMTGIGSGDDYARALLLQPDGKIVVAGYCPNGSTYDFCLARYTSNGSLDTAFGAGGKVITGISSNGDYAHAIVLQPDEKVVVAGTCFGGSNDDFCLARYLSNGSLDSSFGSGGKVITAIGGATDSATALALQPDGKIVAAGHCGTGLTDDFCVARYQSNGSLDTSFNGTGMVITPIGSSADRATGLALQPDGKIVLAGYCLNGSNYDFCLARYQTNGSLDSAFGAGGKVMTAIGPNNDNATALALQPDGRIVVAGYCINGGIADFCIARYQSNGSLDTRFNGTGMVITPIGGSTDRAAGLAIQPDGKIVLAGYCANVANDDFCLARYESSGAIDTGFGVSGKVITPIGSDYDTASALALQPDGKIVIAGYCLNGADRDFCLARYEGGPFGYQNCKPDFDGDGVMRATTDGLVLARVLLGMTGSAVVGGISFSANATRTTWPQLRDYFMTQCGMSLVP
ncbi:MAG: hypothetical protein JNL19_13245 [Burkholderiales bacterium]|nr:hypothetical protein [Burkholderiales bacterium]